MSQVNWPVRAMAGIAAGATALALAAGAYGRFIEVHRPRVERITVPLPAAHAGLAGLRIGFLTDLHYGPFVTIADLDRAVSLVLAAQPDLILLGGDYISESPRYTEAMAAVIARLVPAAPLGVYAVLGNHDLSTDRERVTAALTAQGIRVLTNDAARLDTNRGQLWLAGTDDAVLGQPDVAAAFAGIPAGAAIISLWHEPDFAAEAAARGAFFQLSGHTHGGQVRFPLFGPLVLPPAGRKYPMGRYQIGEMVLYVSRGIGAYRPPMRLNAPPEITLIELIAPTRPG